MRSHDTGFPHCFLVLVFYVVCKDTLILMTKMLWVNGRRDQDLHLHTIEAYIVKLLDFGYVDVEIDK